MASNWSWCRADLDGILVPLFSGHVTRVRVVCGDEAGGGEELQLARPGGGESSESGALSQTQADKGDESLLISVLADSRASVCVLVPASCLDSCCRVAL